MERACRAGRSLSSFTAAAQLNWAMRWYAVPICLSSPKIPSTEAFCSLAASADRLALLVQSEGFIGLQSESISLSFSVFRLSLAFFSFNSFSERGLSGLAKRDLALVRSLPARLLVFSFTELLPKMSRLERRGGFPPGLGVIRLAGIPGASATGTAAFSNFGPIGARLRAGRGSGSGGTVAPGVEAFRGGWLGVEGRDDFSCRIGEGEGECGAGESSRTCGEENSSSFAATPVPGLGVVPSNPKLGLKAPTEKFGGLTPSRLCFGLQGDQCSLEGQGARFT